MKVLFLEFLYNFWALLNSIAPYILLGVVIAGAFKLLLPDSFIKKHLGQSHFISNIKATLLGIPLPLCSCSVIPFISTLRKGGATKSATLTFLIATPITGADSIFATYGVFGWVFTLYRIISSIVIALIAGLLALFINTEKEVIDEQKPQEKSSPIGKPLNIKVVKAEDKQNIFMQIIATAFDDIFKGIARSLMIGVVLGALIVTFIPDNIASFISSSAMANYLLILLVSMPLYICATASIPLGLSFMAAGFSPGAAFILLTAGPATNTVTMSVVLKELGKSTLMIYLASVFLGSLLFGVMFDYAFADSMANISLMNIREEDPGFIAQVSSVILLYLSLKYILNKSARMIGGGGCGSGGCAT